MVKENSEGEFQVFTQIEYTTNPEVTIRINQMKNGESNTVYLQGGLLADFFSTYSEALDQQAQAQLEGSSEEWGAEAIAPFPVPEDQDTTEREETQEGPADTTQQDKES